MPFWCHSLQTSVTAALVRPASHKQLSDLKKVVGRLPKTSSKSTSAYPTYWLWQHPGLNKTSHTTDLSHIDSIVIFKQKILLFSRFVSARPSRASEQDRRCTFSLVVPLSDTPLLSDLHAALTQRVAGNWVWQNKDLKKVEGLIACPLKLKASTNKNDKNQLRTGKNTQKTIWEDEKMKHDR